MRVKNLAYRLACAICALMVVACVDDTFDLDNLSTEVTVGGGTTILPLGYLEDKSIADLLGNQTIEGLEIDENGNISFNYSGESTSMSMDGIASEFEIPMVENSFGVDYPEFNLNMKGVVIEDDYEVVVTGLEDYKVVPEIPGEYESLGDYYIPEDQELPTIKGAYSNVLEGDDLRIAFTVPEQVDEVTKVFFRDVEDGHSGAPMHFVVDFNDVTPINDGGEMELNLKMTGGKFRILNSDNVQVGYGSEYSASYPIESGAEKVDFAIYFESLTTESELDENHRLDIPLTLEYDVNFNIQAKAGRFELYKQPHLELYSNFEYGDAEVDVNPDINLVECDVKDGKPITIAGLPQEVKKVNEVAMVQNENAKLRLFAHGMEWMEDNSEFLEVSISLPEFLILRQISGEDYIFDEKTHVLTTNIMALSEGVDIAIDALSFEGGIKPDANGEINLEFAPHIVVNFEEGTHVNVSSLAHDDDLVLSVGIESAKLSVESVSGIVDYSYEVNEEFVLPGLDQLNVEIGGLGLKPVIEVGLTHPLTMKAMLEGLIIPKVGGEANEANAIAFGPVALKKATSSNGVVMPAEMRLIIADASLEDQYSDPKYTFVPCDVAALLRGSMPEELSISLKLAVDSTEVQTIAMTDEMTISYDYRITLPFVIDNSFEVRYTGKVEDLNSMFEMIAGYNIKVGDVAIIATITNTTPLELAADVVLKDVEGNDTAAQVYLDGDAKISGSSDGVTPAESVVRLVLDLGEDGKVSNVAAVDAIFLELTATSAAEESAVPLNESQYIGVKLQLELDGGITIDFNQLNQ